MDIQKNPNNTFTMKGFSSDNPSHIEEIRKNVPLRGLSSDGKNPSLKSLPKEEDKNRVPVKASSVEKSESKKSNSKKGKK